LSDKRVIAVWKLKEYNQKVNPIAISWPISLWWRVWCASAWAPRRRWWQVGRCE